MVSQWLNCHACLFWVWMVAAVVRLVLAPSHALQFYKSRCPFMGSSDAASCSFSVLRGKCRWWNTVSSLHHTFSHAVCMCKRGTAGSQPMDQGSSGSVYPNALSSSIHSRPQNAHLHSSRVIKWRTLAGGRIDCASDLGPEGVGRTSHEAAGAHQM